jgi:predicted nuclease of predicted toxin-antitoxin system
MARTIRFHLDECCDPRIADGLRLHGVDVTTSHDTGLLHAADAGQLAFAVAERRVLITQDADFLRMSAAGERHPGVVYFAPDSRSIGQVISAVHLIWEILEPEEMDNHIEYV